MEPGSGLRDGQEQDSLPSPHSPVAFISTLTSSLLHVSTGLFQTVTPPCVVSTLYQDAVYLREQAEALHQEEV